jgi:hypothetical protein
VLRSKTFGPSVKFTPLLATPLTVTPTFPVVAPLGTVAVMLVELQAVVVAVVPLKVTLPLELKFVPRVVTGVSPALPTDREDPDAEKT